MSDTRCIHCGLKHGVEKWEIVRQCPAVGKVYYSDHPIYGAISGFEYVSLKEQQRLLSAALLNETPDADAEDG